VDVEMTQSAAALDDQRASEPRAGRLWAAYAAEGLTSIATTLLMIGIFFFTSRWFRWGVGRNFLLAVGQGVTYIFGALSADAVARRLGGRRAALVWLYSGMGLAAAVAAVRPTPVIVVLVLLAYTVLGAMSWPMLESLVSSDADAHTLSRRVGVYNLVWSGVGAVSLAGGGSVIEFWPRGVFLIPVLVHATSAVLLARAKRGEAAAAAAAATPPHGHAAPESGLIAKRTLALWLSRIALPAVYVVIYSLVAMMPSLPVLNGYDTSVQTVIGSAWLAARWLTFAALLATTWWHTRPLVLLAAAAVMLAGFLGVTVPPRWWLHAFAAFPPHADLLWMIGWQLVLGASIGVIYAGSLYFGMVLSEGSTEHGGYHEALIGLGSVLGPGAGAAAQWARPGSIGTGIAAVATVVAASVGLAAAAALALRARRAKS